MAISANFQIQDLICVAPALFIFIGSLLPLTLKVLNKNKEINSIYAVGMVLLAVAGSIGVSALLYTQQKGPYYAFSNAIVIDGISVFSAIMIAAIAGLAVLISREHLTTHTTQFSEYLFLLLNSALGMMIFSWSNDLIVTFIGIEIMSLCLYLLIALSREEKLSKEAAIKYFVLGSFASAVFLYGVAFIYGMTNTTYLNGLTQLSPALIGQSNLFFIGVALTVFGFCFKAAIVPFHAWTPDVYEGAPTPVTAYMAAAVKIVTFVAFMRFLRGNYISQADSGEFVTVLEWLAVGTMLVGNITAIAQNNFKRMLAYSSIAHGGYIFIALIAASIGGESWRGDLAVIYYVFAYAIMTFGAFAAIGLLEKNENSSVSLEDVKGLAKREPWAAGILTLFLLSLAGIPPLLGFFGKFFIFSAVIKQGLFWLAIWAAINSVISAYYYLRPIVYMYMSDDVGLEVSKGKPMTKLIVLCLAALLILLGLMTEPLYEHLLQTINTLV